MGQSCLLSSEYTFYTMEASLTAGDDSEGSPKVTLWSIQCTLLLQQTPKASSFSKVRFPTPERRFHQFRFSGLQKEYCLKGTALRKLQRRKVAMPCVLSWSYQFDLSVATSVVQVLCSTTQLSCTWLCFCLSEGKVKSEPLDKTR